METEKNPWKRLARKAVYAKVREAQKSRDLDIALGEMSDKLTRLEKERDSVAASSEKLIAQKDETLRHLKNWCDHWIKGEFSALDIVAGFIAVLGGDLLAEPTILERRRAVENMHVLSLMSQATTRLTEIEVMLHDAGIPNETDQVDQVRTLLAKHREARGSADV